MDKCKEDLKEVKWWVKYCRGEWWNVLSLKGRSKPLLESKDEGLSEGVPKEEGVGYFFENEYFINDEV